MRWLKRTVVASLGLAAISVLVVLLYLGAALLGAVIPKNSDFRPPDHDGIVVWVSCGEIHSDIVVPATNQYCDWTQFLSRKDALQVDSSFGWVAMGWGDRRFFVETPTWSDVKLKNVASAAVGIDACAMHVQWLAGDLAAGPECRPIRLDSAEYARLCGFLRDSFTQESGQPIRVPSPGYGPHDVFYEAQGRYSAINDCNSWTGEALANSGVRVGAWTPMKWGVLWQLE